MPRPRGLPKTGGRKKGVGNKHRVIAPEVLPPGTAESMMAEAARAVVLASAPVRTPKAVMLDAMIHFETLGRGFLAKADRLMKTRASPDKVAEAAQEGHKFIVAAVECATKAAPYIHARLLAVESRGDMTQDRAPFVLRAPAVMADSAAWQEAVGAAVLDMEASQQASGGQPEVLTPQALPEPTPTQGAPAPPPVALAVNTGRITVMPPGPRIVQPSGSEEWLASIKKVG